jgi:hypothetical protein
MTDWLVWLDASPWRYGALCVLAYLAALALCLLPAVALRSSRRLRSDGVFLAAVALLMLAFRWQVFYFPQHLNPDESSYISQSLTLVHDPVYWRSITAGTSGPFNTYPRLIPALLGFADNFATSRVMAMLVAIVSLSVFYATCRRFSHASLARMATLAAATFWALTTNGDFTHYSGEHLPVLLLLVASYLALRLPDSARLTSGTAWLAGFVLGAIPFAKLQGSVLALAITFFCYVFLLRRGESWPRRLGRCGWLTLGGLTAPALVAGSAAASGQFDHFWQSYIAMNVGYAGNGVSLVSIIENLPNLRPYMPRFVTLFHAMMALGTLGALSLAWLRLGRPMPIANRRLLIFSSVLFPIAVYTALAPGRPFAHYFLFILFPVVGWAFAVCSAAIASQAQATEETDSATQLDSASSKPLSFALAAWLTVGLCLQISEHFFSPQLLPVRGFVGEFLKTPRSKVSEAILAHASPGEGLAVWGWMNQFHAETGLWKATSDQALEYLWNVKTEGVSVSSWMELVPDYFEDLYLADLKRSNPPIFVDAVAPGSFIFNNRASFGYETFPALAEHINSHYSLAGEIDGVRIFLRKDR